MHPRCNLCRAKNSCSRLIGSGTFYHSAARLQASDPARKQDRLRSISPLDGAGSQHNFRDGDNGLEKPKWRKVVLQDGNSNGVVNNATLPSEVWPTTSAREAREAVDKTYSRIVAAKPKIETADTTTPTLYRRTVDRKTLIRFHGVKKKDDAPGITDRVVEQVKPLFASFTPSPPGQPEALEQSKTPATHFARVLIRRHIARSKSEKDAERLSGAYIKKHIARREYLIQRHKDRRRERTLTIKHYLASNQLLEGHGAFLRLRAAYGPRRTAKSSKRIRRTLTNPRGGSIYLQREQSNSNIKDITRTTPCVKSTRRRPERQNKAHIKIDGLKTRWLRNKPSIPAVANPLEASKEPESQPAQESEDQKDMLELQEALNELTYAPPRRPVTFTKFTPRRRLCAALRQRPRAAGLQDRRGK